MRVLGLKIVTFRFGYHAMAWWKRWWIGAMGRSWIGYGLSRYGRFRDGRMSNMVLPCLGVRGAKDGNSSNVTEHGTKETGYSWDMAEVPATHGMRKMVEIRAIREEMRDTYWGEERDLGKRLDIGKVISTSWAW